MRALRFALRQLIKTPGFTIVALITLALGIGVNTSMYTLVDVLLFRSAPFPEPDRLVAILGTTAQTQRDGFSFAEIEEMRVQTAGPADTSATAGPTHTLESLTTFSGWNNTLAEPGQPAERLSSVDASADFFTTFRVQPFLGRPYTAAEEVPGHNQVALLSYALWQSRFGGDPNVIGRSIRLNAEPVTVIGVMPASFSYPLLWGKVDLWRPITIPRHIVEDRDNRFFGAIGRLNPGITREQVHAQLAPLAAHPHLAGRAVDFQWPDPHPVGRLALAHLRATQNRSQARQQFPRVEWLGQIVIRPDFNPHDAVHVVAARGEHDDGNIGKGAHAAAHLQPVDPRQHHVENDGVVPTAALGLQSAFPIVAAIDLVPVRTQIPAQHFDQAGVVVDQKNAGWHVTGWQSATAQAVAYMVAESGSYCRSLAHARSRDAGGRHGCGVAGPASDADL